MKLEQRRSCDANGKCTGNCLSRVKPYCEKYKFIKWNLWKIKILYLKKKVKIKNNKIKK